MRLPPIDCSCLTAGQIEVFRDRLYAAVGLPPPLTMSGGYSWQFADMLPPEPEQPNVACTNQKLRADVADSPAHIDRAIQEERRKIARTHRVWPTCPKCGGDLEVKSNASGFGPGKCAIYLKCSGKRPGDR